MSKVSDFEFFRKQETIDALNRFLQVLSNYPSNESEAVRLIEGLLIKIIGMMVDKLGLFDRHCGANIAWIGEDFIREVEAVGNVPDVERFDVVCSIFAFAFRFLCELDFSFSEGIDFRLNRLIDAVDEKLDSFPKNVQRKIIFARYLMAAKIAKKFLNDSGVKRIDEIDEIDDKLNKASSFRDSWCKEIEEQKKEIEMLSDHLSKVAEGFNFVGLFDGFKALAKSKNQEKVKVRRWLVAFGFLMIVSPIFQIIYIILNVDSIGVNKGVLIYALPAVLAVEILLVYFFRVLLSQFHSVEAQILQLDLRVSLCQFIQSYVDFSITIKQADPNALARFEALVFSGLAPDNESIPSTFDGVEQLANLFKSIRG